jgi:GT2 family glycosyltransferase
VTLAYAIETSKRFSLFRGLTYPNDVSIFRTKRTRDIAMTENQADSNHSIHFSIVVANWNGEAFLARCLSSALLSARGFGHSFEVLVVDDGSTDTSVGIIHRQFPQVRLLTRRENRGFAATVNEGVEAALGRYVILLNNDIVVREGFCAAMLAHFERDEHRQDASAAGGRLFGVTAKTVEWDGRRPNYVKMDAVWQKGDLRLVWADPSEAAPTFFLQAGACAFVRERFLELGGLETFFAPGYWEDFDLSWRALARGWCNIYEPSSPAFHLGKASFRRLYGDVVLRQLTARNHLLFLWANLTDMPLLLSHCLWLPVRIGREVLSGRMDTLRALIRALPKLGAIIRSRRRRSRLRVVRDRDILVSVDTQGSRLSEP